MSRRVTRKPPQLRTVAAPKQARSEATLQRLLDAAEALIAEKGIADVSVPEIVARAGSSVGGFYARFKDKDELLRALEERFLAEMRDLLDEIAAPGRWAGAGIPEIARAGIETLIQVFQDRRSLLVAFMGRAATGTADTLQEVRALRRDASARFVSLLHARSEEFGHPDPALAVDLAVQLVFGFMQQMIVFGEVRAGARVLSDSEIADELVRNVLSYLGAPNGAAAVSPA